MTSQQLAAEIRAMEAPHRVYGAGRLQGDGRVAIDWAGMRNKGAEYFRRYVELRGLARQSGLPELLRHD